MQAAISLASLFIYRASPVFSESDPAALLVLQLTAGAGDVRSPRIPKCRFDSRCIQGIDPMGEGSARRGFPRAVVDVVQGDKVDMDVEPFAEADKGDQVLVCVVHPVDHQVFEADPALRVAVILSQSVLQQGKGHILATRHDRIADILARRMQ